MKVRLGQIVDSFDGDAPFNRVMAIPQVPAASVLSKHIIRRVYELMRDFDATRKEILNRLGTLNAETNVFEFGDNLAQWEKEFAELCNAEVVIPGNRLKIADIKGYVVPMDLLPLEWLIDDGFIAPEEEQADAPQPESGNTSDLAAAASV